MTCKSDMVVHRQNVVFSVGGDWERSTCASFPVLALGSVRYARGNHVAWTCDWQDALGHDNRALTSDHNAAWFPGPNENRTFEEYLYTSEHLRRSFSVPRHAILDIPASRGVATTSRALTAVHGTGVVLSAMSQTDYIYGYAVWYAFFYLSGGLRHNEM